MDPRFAIVGGGLSGVAALDGLVKTMVASDIHKGTIAVFEPADIVGPGRPYRLDQPYSWLLNYAAEKIGTLNGGPLGFVHWMEQHRPFLSQKFALAMKHGWIPTAEDGLIEVKPTTYYPRNMLGYFLQWCFKAIKKDAEAKGFEVLVIKEAVQSMSQQADGQLMIEDYRGNQYYFNQCIMASGHTYAPRTSEYDEWDSYVSNIYNTNEREATLDLVPAEGKTVPHLGVVAVKGTGLSANDAVLWLLDQKERGYLTYDKILMVSRRGQLRKIRGKIGEHKMQYLTPEALENKLKTEGRFSLDWILAEFCKEMQAAYGSDDPVDWENIWNPKTADMRSHLAKSLEEATDTEHAMPWASVWYEFAKIRQGVFEHLSAEDKGRFFKEFSTIWTSYHAPMPPQSARRLLKMMDAGELKVEAGCASITPSTSGEHKYDLTILTSENGRPYLTHARDTTEVPEGVVKEVIVADFLIDALGSTMESRLFPAPYPSLLKQGLLRAHQWGGIEVDPHTLHPIQANGKPWEEVYQVGVNSQGDILIVADAPIDIIDSKRIAVSMVSKWTQQIRGQGAHLQTEAALQTVRV